MLGIYSKEDDDFTGKGLIIYKNGDKYEGEILNGVIEGYGVNTTLHHHTYEGEFENGMRNGRGIMTYKSTIVNKYDGEWLDNKKHGCGKMINGRKQYDGEWKCGKRHGHGIEICNSYSSSKSNIPEYIYDGEWVYNKKHGNGIITWDNGEKYEGEWKNGYKKGQCKYTYKNGNVYEGKWYEDGRTKDSYPGGEGTMTYADGKVVHQKWFKGRGGALRGR